MKTKIAFPFFKPVGLLAAILALAAGQLAAKSPGRELVAHEWGTFTSFQAADGVLLKWRTLTASGLPSFVVHYNQPGPGLYPLGDPVLTPPKSDIYSLQRIETPVVYFYDHAGQTVDVRVNFPHGLITEWYPAASQYGPSQPATTRDGSRSPLYVPGSESAASMIRWSGLRVLSDQESGAAGAHFAADKTGSHYFAARETDANPVLTGSPSLSAAPECEKFLFYRGVGNFATPLVVTMPSDDSMTIANHGKEKLGRLFVVGVMPGAAGFVDAGQLDPGASKSVALNFWETEGSKARLEEKLGLAMKSALVAEGLYPHEADAMVKTWKDSWFGEDGFRVLYLLPRKWTDSTLPMQVNPAPRELVRVMVGRAEVFAPATERRLIALLPKVRDNEPGADVAVGQILGRLGRFAEPAFRRISAGLDAGHLDNATRERVYAPLDRVEQQLARR